MAAFSFRIASVRWLRTGYGFSLFSFDFVPREIPPSASRAAPLGMTPEPDENAPAFGMHLRLAICKVRAETLAQISSCCFPTRPVADYLLVNNRELS
jgi:hypothetical protein